MRSIHIYCDGGFGNRLNGLISGLLLCQHTGAEPIVNWPSNNWCGAHFSEIFENTDFKVIERELYTYVPEKTRFQFFMTEDHLKMGVPNISPLEINTLDQATNYLLGDSKDIFFHSPLIPIYLDLQSVCSKIRNLKICRNLLEKASAFIAENRLAKPFYGLQIRKTDFGANSADDQSLHELVQKSSNSRFFVCSDNEEVERRFKKLPNVAVYEKQSYVEKLVEGDWTALAADHSGRVYPCNVKRSATSVLDAVVDLLILSHSEIVKTSNSTFLNAALLLKAARETSGQPMPEENPAPPQPSKASLPLKPLSGRSVTISGTQPAMETYCQWHLGDNLLHLHFLRKLSDAYPDIIFHHALNQQYIVQCGELVEDKHNIKLIGLSEAKFNRPIDAWKGAENFFFEHPRKFEFGALYLDFFTRIASKMGLRSPIVEKTGLLFDYPALLRNVLPKSYDFLVVNSAPLSEQFKTYSEETFRKIVKAVEARGFSVITTKKVEGFDCTMDTGLSVTGIGNVSLGAHFLVAVCTGAMWPSINAFNNYRHEQKIILNDHETIDFGRNVTMARKMSEVEELVSGLLGDYQPIRKVKPTGYPR